MLLIPGRTEGLLRGFGGVGLPIIDGEDGKWIGQAIEVSFRQRGRPCDCDARESRGHQSVRNRRAGMGSHTRDSNGTLFGHRQESEVKKGQSRKLVA